MKIDRDFYTVRGYQRLDNETKMLTSSMEDYMEMIYRSHLKEGYVRINQLAASLNVKPSSTTKVVQKLSELNLVEYKKYGIIQLTEEGIMTGKFLLQRHEIIQEFLENIGMKETLLKDIELMEHDVSPTTLEAIYTLNQFLDNYPEIKNLYNTFKLAKQSSNSRVN